jgi:hypothetical protein
MRNRPAYRTLVLVEVLEECWKVEAIVASMKIASSKIFKDTEYDFYSIPS